jgi:cation transport ATPase
MLLARNHVDEEDEEDEVEHDPRAVQTAIASQEIAEDLRAEREDREPINQLVDRLFRVVILGLIFWPLQVYSLWLLFQLMHVPGTVSANRRWKAWASFLLTPIVVFLAFVIGFPCVFSMP